MEIGLYQVLTDPVLIVFVALTLLAIAWKFLKMWVVSLITCSIVSAIIIVIIVTIGQFAGGEDIIRYFITSHYRLFGVLDLSFGNILMILVLVVSFQLGLAGHTLHVEKSFQERLAWFPKRMSHHYEMEHTIESFFKKQWR